MSKLYRMGNGSILTEKDMRMIKELRRRKHPHRKVSDLYGISSIAVYFIENDKEGAYEVGPDGEYLVKPVVRKKEEYRAWKRGK